MTPDTLLPSKQAIRARITEGELREATAAAIRYAEYCQSAETLNNLQILSARLEQDIAHWSTGQIAYEDFSRAQAQVTHQLLACTDGLPNTPAPGAGRNKLLEEAQLQRHLFALLLLCKGFVLAWVWYRWTQTGALNTERAMTLFGVLAPTFLASAYAMTDFYLKKHQNHALLPTRRVVSGPLVNIAYALMPLYALAMWYVLQMGIIWRDWNFATMTAVMSGLETAFGGLIAKVVAVFFKSE